MTPEDSALPRRQRGRLALVLVLGASVMGVGLATEVGSASASTPAKQTVTASLTEYHITLSKKSFAPGSYVFVATNNGQTSHALAITGTGKTNKSTAMLAPGQSANLKVTLRKGSYDIFCPVPGHKALGMNVNITVKTGGGKSTSSGSTSSGSTSSSNSTSGGSSGGGYGY